MDTKRRRNRIQRALFASAFLAMTAGLVACGANSMSPKFDATGASVNADASLGATVGGAQDIAFARKQIQKGLVPAPDSILTEGLFSEHDLTLTGEPADKLLSLNLGSGMLRDASGAPHYVVQVGMTSNLDANSFRRRPLNLALAVDVSGSMRGEKIAAARRAAHHMLRQLESSDYFSIISFESDADVEISSRRVTNDERDDFIEEIEDLEASGGTNMEEGLRYAFKQVERHREKLQGYEHRVVLITDAQPNTGRWATSDFLSLVERQADRGIGLSAFGVGANFGIDLATSISNIRGGNYRYLARASELGEIFAEDFEFLMTPLAYDFELKVHPGPGMRIRRIHGMPDWEDGDSLAESKAATVFVSKNGGAIAIELEPTSSAATTGDRQLASVGLNYVEIGGRQQKEAMTASLPAGAANGVAYFSHDGVAKTTTLAFAAEAMRRACESFHNREYDRALEHLSGVADILTTAADKTGDSALLGEAQLVRNLASNIVRHKASYAPRGKSPHERPHQPYHDDAKPQPRQVPKESLPSTPQPGGPAPIRW